jgi:hypothetical protein
MDRDINEIRKEYAQLVRRVRSRVQRLKIDDDIFTASADLARDGMSAAELEKLDESRHHFVGAIITFYREMTVG